ncbi:MFS transporter [Mucilaginibacter limnophilus]|uniref:MFS transporter n=1 Tax=Mucilaginibacter limnophilus TaxID=1932778 RepID=A0A437ML85_9SPHI|nr:MFS transporter [Mucilaginibacter limnophilus]RVT98375.1 MFS transporter [Mucilaginibacter limnophilus]
MNKPSGSLFQLAVILSALGFFVDIYDLLLFTIVRKASLADLGLNAARILTQGELLISTQMIGMLLGGILFGILGDKKGRLKVLFASILLYSIANILNGMVTTVNQYIILRFIAGVGLAGELGAGVTLVSELLPKEKRGTAAGLIAGFGLMGAVTAFFVHEQVSWRGCYYIGGALGIILLLLRFQIKESSLFNNMHSSNVSKGNFLMFFTNRRRFVRYMQIILIGIPVWYIIGVLITFSDKFGEELGITGVDPARAVMFLYLAIAVGDVSVGWLSEKLRSRKKVFFIFYGITILFTIFFFLQPYKSTTLFYWICVGLGFGSGFNVIYLTMGVEQFGTNLRASAGISVPNMVRGSVPLIILLFKSLRDCFSSYLTGGWITGLILFSIGVVAAVFLEETHGKELDFVEE